MKSFSANAGMILFLIVSACSGGRYMEMTQAGEEAYMDGDYRKTLEITEKIINDLESRGKQASGPVYSMAGVSAFELKEYGKSLGYLSQAEQMGYSEESLYLFLAKNYRHVDNLSKEISALESYLELHPEGRQADRLRSRLLETCLESENYPLSRDLWSQMDSMAREDIRNLEVYLKLNIMQENQILCDSLADRILAEDADNETAMKWLAESLFWKAENNYQQQMKAYRENRTHKQYAILLEAFKQVSADFRKSRDYFLKLYELYPDPEYAGYLGNIFTRLEDEERAEYYRKRSRQH
jgi:tetratricopeptide (TPR) repeat protein